jgi:methyl-accepting chemotaxis protein
VTQSNAAGAEESAAASEELSSQAEQLKSVVADLLVLVGSSHGNAAPVEREAAPRRAPVNQAAPRVANKPALRPRTGAPVRNGAVSQIPLEGDVAAATADFSEFDQQSAAA